MSLQERTLVIKNFDPEKTTNRLLKELCIQGGPVRNVVVKPDHAFVEYEDVDSVGYSKALLDGIELFGKKLIMEPKMRALSYFKYTQILQDYIKYDKHRQQLELQQQQVLAYHHQQQAQAQLQQQQQPHFIDPSLNAPVNFVQQPDPQAFNYNPFAIQSQFIAPPNQLPSASMQPCPNNDNNVRRSRSFNQHHQRAGQFNRSRSARTNDWSRRR